MADERLGWGGEFHLHDGTSLVELANVLSMEPPEDTTDEFETTHLKSAGKRREFIRGLIDGGNITVELGHVPASTTDTLLLAALAAGDTRAWEIHIPDTDGTPIRKYSGTGYVSSYKVNTVTPGEGITSTLVVRVTGAVTEGAVA